MYTHVCMYVCVYVYIHVRLLATIQQQAWTAEPHARLASTREVRFAMNNCMYICICIYRDICV